MGLLYEQKRLPGEEGVGRVKISLHVCNLRTRPPISSSCLHSQQNKKHANPVRPLFSVYCLDTIIYSTMSSINNTNPNTSFSQFVSDSYKVPRLSACDTWAEFVDKTRELPEQVRYARAEVNVLLEKHVPANDDIDICELLTDVVRRWASDEEAIPELIESLQPFVDKYHAQFRSHVGRPKWYRNTGHVAIAIYKDTSKYRCLMLHEEVMKFKKWISRALRMMAITDLNCAFKEEHLPGQLHLVDIDHNRFSPVFMDMLLMYLESMQTIEEFRQEFGGIVSHIPVDPHYSSTSALTIKMFNIVLETYEHQKQPLPLFMKSIVESGLRRYVALKKKHMIPKHPGILFICRQEQCMKYDAHATVAKIWKQMILWSKYPNNGVSENEFTAIRMLWSSFGSVGSNPPPCYTSNPRLCELDVRYDAIIENGSIGKEGGYANEDAPSPKKRRVVSLFDSYI